MAKKTDGRRSALTAGRNRGTAEVAAQPGSWLRESSERIQSLRKLGRDWDSYGAEAPSSSALHWAGRALELLRAMDFRPYWIDPSAEGGVMIAFRRGSRFGSIEYYNTGDIVALTSNGEGDVETWPVTEDERDMEEALTRIRDYICG